MAPSSNFSTAIMFPGRSIRILLPALRLQSSPDELTCPSGVAELPIGTLSEGFRPAIQTSCKLATLIVTERLPWRVLNSIPLKDCKIYKDFAKAPAGTLMQLRRNSQDDVLP